MPLELRSGSFTHTGLIREDNQDSLRIAEPADAGLAQSYGSLYAVADGMGGYSYGDVASRLALEALFAEFYTSRPGKALERLQAGVRAANLEVQRAAHRLKVARMGSTLTALNIAGARLSLVHIGDSRAYLIRGRRAACLTSDHTLVGDLVRARLLSPDKVRTHSQRSVLNKCLGLEMFVQPDTAEFALQAGDRLVLCSDGVWAVIEDQEFARVVHDLDDPAAASQRLTELAMERASDDNVSAVVVHVQQLDEPAWPAAAPRRWPGWLESARRRLTPGRGA